MANEEYKKAKIHIAHILGWFDCELQKETNTGSPIDARRELIRALALFSGTSEKQIKESLAEFDPDKIDEAFESLRNEPQPDWDAITKEFRKHATQNEDE
jgi:hypothetical protein